MPFELIHVRYRDHEQCPIMVLSSTSHHFQPEHSEASARRYITSCSKNTDEPSFVVFFGPDDLPREAYAVRREQWRNLDMAKAPPLPANLAELNLYQGVPGVSPYLVTRW